MANDLTRNPLKIDTTGTIYATGANKIKIAGISLTSATAAGTAIIQDGAGKEIARLSTPIAGDAFRPMQFPILCDGLIVNALPTGGVLHVYCM